MGDRRPSEAASAIAQHRVEEWTKRHYSVAQLPRREITEPMFKEGPVRSIDSTTEIPEDLFESLLRRGDERRRAGQHVLAKRSQKLGGGVKLVHPERLEYMKASSRYNQTSSRYNLASLRAERALEYAAEAVVQACIVFNLFLVQHTLIRS